MIDKLVVEDLQIHPSSYSMVTGIKGLGTPAPRQVVTPRPSRHGSLDFTRYHDARVVTIEGVSWGDALTSPWASFDAVKQRFALSDLSRTITLRLSGRTTDEVLFCKIATPLDDETKPGHIKWAVTVLCADPRIYGASLKSSSYDPTAALSGGGMAMPVTFPIMFATVLGQSLDVTNDGQFNTPPYFTIHGPVINPSIDNGATGESVRIVFSLGVNDAVEVDVANRQVLLNGASRPDLFDAATSVWWNLNPGVTNIFMRGTGMVPGVTSLTVQFRDARI